MIEVLKNKKELFDFCRNSLNMPYAFDINYSNWHRSMFNDIDGNGEKLFKELFTFRI